MRVFLLLTSITLIFSCKGKIGDWEVYKDRYNISSISFPNLPAERIDTTTNSLVNYTMLSTLDSIDTSPSVFAKHILYPVNIAELDLFTIKKDSNRLNSLFMKMIDGALNQSNSILKSKDFFIYPEPGVKFVTIDQTNSMKTVSRIIIFDNLVINTNATGKSDIFDEETEVKFFNSLKINRDKSDRK
ncbi:hypothetical protein [Pseudopedobacter beijingensis]|uniref:Uncharacterized protein n=1 Tax=Pseudopedobacter beijingensis TaxID=1207056 RepID=A0ABW4IEW7_9SPHI